MTQQWCKFETLTKGSKCVHCPRVLTRDYAKHPIAPCLLQCRHLGASTRLLRIPCGCTAKSEAAIAAGKEPPIVSVPTALCALAAHPHCIPGWSPHKIEKWREQPESQMYQLCSACDDQSLVVQSPPPAVLPATPPVRVYDLEAAVCELLAPLIPEPFDVATSVDVAPLTSPESLDEVRSSGRAVGSGTKLGEVRRASGAFQGALDAAMWEVQQSVGVPIETRSRLIYPPGTGMAWHTNGNAPGVRAYLIYNESPGSVFRYAVDDGPPVDVSEPAGWHLKSFTIPTPPSTLWHAVVAGCWRTSIGFMVAPCVSSLSRRRP